MTSNDSNFNLRVVVNNHASNPSMIPEELPRDTKTATVSLPRHEYSLRLFRAHIYSKIVLNEKAIFTNQQIRDERYLAPLKCTIEDMVLHSRIPSMNDVWAPKVLQEPGNFDQKLLQRMIDESGKEDGPILEARPKDAEFEDVA